MAGLCTSCGAKLSSGAAFCTSCGSLVVEDDPIAGMSGETVPFAPYGEILGADSGPLPPVEAPEKEESKGSKRKPIVLAILAAVVLLAAGSVAAFRWKKMHRQIGLVVTQAAAQNPAVPAAKPAPLGVAESGLGVPDYPGATEDDIPQTVDTASARFVQVTFHTADPDVAVVAYYREKLGKDVSVMALGEQTILNAGSGNNTVTMMIAPDAGTTKVTVIHTLRKGS